VEKRNLQAKRSWTGEVFFGGTRGGDQKSLSLSASSKNQQWSDFQKNEITQISEILEVTLAKAVTSKNSIISNI
jgi:hypothetical protein